MISHVHVLVQDLHYFSYMYIHYVDVPLLLFCFSTDTIGHFVHFMNTRLALHDM